MVAAAQAPLLAPEDDGQIPAELRRRVEDSLSVSDKEMLLRLRLVERMEVHDENMLNVLWMMHHGLLSTDVDPSDRVFLVITPITIAFVDPPQKKRRRRRRKKAETDAG
jgi:hypothetical protein